MLKGKKAALLFLASSMVFGSAVPAMADNDKRITSVSLEITSDIQVGEDMTNDSIDVESSSSRYTVDSWEILNTGFMWMEDDVPQIKVYLTAEDGYYFSLTSSKVRLKGAKYVTASKRDSSTTLMITMNLPSLAESVGEIEKVTLGEDGIARWDETIGAGTYEVRVQRDGKNTGTTATVRTTSYDLKEFLGRPGVYSVRVRPVNKIKQDIKGQWTDSNTFYVDSSLAEDFRMGRVKVGGRWEEEGSQWRFREVDGSYASSKWKEIEGIWYYFDVNGYMMTGWIEVDGKWYYCDTTGAMLHDTEIDGYALGSDGAMITQ